MHLDITFYFTLVFGIIAPLIVLVLNIQEERNIIYFIIITHTSNFSIIYFASQSHLIHDLPNTPMLGLILDYWALLPVFIFCIGAALLGVV